MGEALGIDLRAAACAAARWRAGTVEGCSLGDGGPTATAADLGATGTPGQAVDAVTATVALLRAVADRAGGRTPGDAVAVAYALTPDDGPRALADRAVAVAFGEASGVTSGESPGQAFVVARPVAVAARVAAGGPDARDGVVAVLDMTGGAVDVALVRVDRHGFDLAGPARTLGAPDDDADMAAHLDGAVDVLDEVIAGAGLGRADIRAVRAVGDPAWLAQLAVQVRVATGLDVAVDPEPEVAAAMGAAILAAGPDRRGRRLAGGVAVVGSAAAPLVAPTPVAGPEVGATAGRAISPGGGPADALGDALGAGLRDGLGHPSGDGPGAALGEAVGDGLADGAGARFGRLADRTGAPDGTVGGAAGEAVGASAGGPPGGATGAAIGGGG
ncbi:MAG: hypothetical protein JXA83_04300, partial [Acidimicrobiales bacterium]|nr:hypothetical protein [Acidimicrobiales bacterium]